MKNKWNIGNLNKGKHLSAPQREKISNTKKQQYIVGKLKLPDNKGRTPWNMGQSMKKETRMKISDSKKGSTPWNIGIEHSADTKRKISLSRKGKTAWNKGVARTLEEKKRMSEAAKRMWLRRKSKLSTKR